MYTHEQNTRGDGMASVDISTASKDSARTAENTHDELRFTADGERMSRLLALLRAQNPRNRLPDRLKTTAATLPICAAPFLLLFAVWFTNITALSWLWVAVVPCAGLPVLLLAFVWQRFGLASWLHRFRDAELLLEADTLVFSLRCTLPGRPRHLRWAMPYSAVTRMEYDRALKSLRVFGSFDETRSRPAGWSFLPAGMRETARSKRRMGQWIELPLVFASPEELLGELERRTGRYISPAMRGDDVADLRDLPGLPGERDRFRRLCVSLLVYSFATMLCIIGVRNHYAANPYRPYPPTAPELLTIDHSPGDSVTLDGCDIELRELQRVAAREGAVCYQLMLVFTNHNETPLRMRVDEPFRDSPGNIGLSVVEGGVRLPLAFSEAPAGYAGFVQPCPELVESGLHVYTTLFFWLEDTASEAVLTINSDYWPPRDLLRDVSYTGESLTWEGQTVKSNEIRFRLSESLLRSLNNN